MKVREFITKLQEFDPEANVIMATDDMYVSRSQGIAGCILGGRDVDEMYEATQAIGIALPKPTKLPVVVLDYSCRGL